MARSAAVTVLGTTTVSGDQTIRPETNEGCRILSRHNRRTEQQRRTLDDSDRVAVNLHPTLNAEELKPVNTEKYEFRKEWVLSPIARIQRMADIQWNICVSEDHAYNTHLSTRNN